ncbi:SDR family oxidoreductase [Lutibacter sp.]|uniref:SDR family oxidoreductase n=1 Tax=Lutibacter sp. TaxID=1925666 RepID=UPI0025C085B2|nr:SDR family oxidoreductase [Lutibacter sp.]MCF6182285.1 SDR family oxidoreductase [Lutibacter sp.]
MILVTGGTGLVGSHLLYKLALQNNSIKAIYRKSSNLLAVKKVFSYYSDDYEALFNKIDWVAADLLDVTTLKNAFENVTKVYHCAALVSFNPKDYWKMRKINIEGTANVVNFCIDAKIDKLCFVSSIATLDKSVDSDIINEESEWISTRNKSGYAITKHGAEIEVWRASQEGVNVVIVNPGVILGAGFWDNGTGELFSKIAKGFNFYSEGVTGFVSVNDVVKIMIALMDSSVINEQFVLVAENLSFKTIFYEIAKAFGKKPPRIKVNKFRSSIVWRVATFWAFITNKNPILTKNSAKSLHTKSYYSSDKIIKTLNFKFEKITSVIRTICTFYNQK